MLKKKEASFAKQPEPAELAAFQANRALADKVLEIVDEHQTSPLPKTYEVLFAYAGGKNNAVSKEIDSIIKTVGSINKYDINQIYENHFSANDKQRRQNDKTNEILKREIDSIIELIKAHSFSNVEYASSLSTTLDKLSEEITAQELTDTVRLLLADSKQMQSEALEMSAMLEQSKLQMQELGAELAAARRTALIDPVTGVGNRSWLGYKLDNDFETKDAADSDYCLVFVDIDHFKRINDEFGHAAGDMVLRYFGSLLLEHVDDSELCARYGGEEFVVLLPDTDMQTAFEFAEKIRKKLEQSKLIFTASKQPLGKVTASFGIAKRNTNDDPDSIMMRADKLLYDAKKNGRNCTVVED